MTNTKQKELLIKAISIAEEAHKGQVDKAGMDYILHPCRVMECCKTIDEKIVAILHDTIEDTYITPAILINTGFPIYIVDAVLSVTKKQGEEYLDFILRSKADKIGRMVKIQDLLDNMNLNRLSGIVGKDIERLNKYIEALRLLID